jgi:DNA-directed RNA polymerase subunit RPC12/RpoP
VRTRKLEVACPVCGSTQVFYTCTTDCCFNHVCGECGATFEPATRPAGGALSAIAPPDPPPDSTDPTAACARCHAPSVCMTEDGAVACWKCGALLILELEEIHPG